MIPLFKKKTLLKLSLFREILPVLFVIDATFQISHTKIRLVSLKYRRWQLDLIILFKIINGKYKNFSISFLFILRPSII